ncbi:LuxR C-terminal-related transcriptional regulator [Raoultibacter phocaeensis]|uniref:LuxR C-terminal-related transcriptional regulator n=1 Tax=Raoultibacter phocaeensis TaxID=2479841 RepID=UPI0015D6177D|nr:LuxR C-terminal-related transcriptional regulator [Raoultibacter phocaeensis]
MQETPVQQGSVSQTTAPDLLNTYLIAGLGFGCFIGWDLIGAFSPATALLAYTDIPDAFVLRLVSLGALVLTYLICKLNADWFFDHRVKAAVISTVLSLAVVVNAACGQYLAIPAPLSVIAWVLFGIGSGVLDLIWCTYLSLIPTRRTLSAIAGGACLGTILFVIAASSSPASISLTAITLIPLASLALLVFLFRGLPESNILPVKDYRRAPALSPAASISVGAHGIIFGFITASMFFISPTAAIAVGGSGIVGSLAALCFARYEPKIDLDNSFIQRVSLPIIVVGLLLLPLLDTAGQVFCGCLVNIALAFSSLLIRGNSCIENAEFQLHPVDRYAQRQIPRWLGFFVGTLTAFVLGTAIPEHDVLFNFVIVGVAGIVVAAFSVYNGNDGRNKEFLNGLLTDQSSPAESESLAKLPSHFYQRCDDVIEHYDLSPREGEIFYLLAKGRNAKHIQEKLCISSSTVKTHIYRIYQKMGINSQQLLIDAVDNGVREEKTEQ